MADDVAKSGPVHLTVAARITYHTLHFAARVLALLYFRAYVRERKKLPWKGSVIISPVHRSNLDMPLLGATCQRRLRYLAKGSLFRSRFWGWFFTAVGAVPLDREVRADRAALKVALAVLERGEALVVFPEGERKEGPWVHPMLDGAAWLSSKSGAPILPVGIGGSAHSMPKGANLPKPGRVVLKYGALIPAPSNPDGSRVSRVQLREHSVLLRSTIQELFDEAQEIAGSPNAPPDDRPPRPE